MKRQKLFIVLSVVVVIVIVTILGITSKPQGIAIINPDYYDTYFEEIGLDPAEFLPTQKQTFAEHNFTYVKQGKETDYITPSAPGSWFGGYSRDWSISTVVDENKESPIKPETYLFKQTDYYYVLVTFNMPYHFDTNDRTIGYIDIGFSNNFKVHSYYAISTTKDGTEYRLENGSLQFLPDTTQIIISNNNESAGFLNMKELTYTYILTFEPTEDNDLDNDMYFSIDLDFYLEKSNQTESIILGFNEFKQNTSRDIYTVTRNSIQYERGEE